MVNMPLLMISHSKVYREEHKGKVIWGRALPLPAPLIVLPATQIFKTKVGTGSWEWTKKSYKKYNIMLQN